MEVAKKLPLRTILLGMVAAVVGGIAGGVLGGLIGSLLAGAMHVSSREGESGYFVISIALIGIVLCAPAVVVLMLYRRGLRRLWLLIGTLVSFGAIIAVGAAGFGAWYASQPHILNTNGPTPMLEFEIKPPDGQPLESLAGVEAELDTDRNVMPAYWNKEAQSSGVRAGYVELYYRTSQRLFVLKFPNHEDRIFKLRLPANPLRQKYKEWSDWRKPDFVAKGAEQPVRASGGNACQIRYRVDYQER
jgi:hypothetical protein